MPTNRRDFMRDTAVVGAGALLPGLAVLPQGTSAAQTAGTSSLDVAEWSFFWVGVERAELARGTVVNGKQMYVEHQIPAQVRHPYPIVLVHGGGGQGSTGCALPMGAPAGRHICCRKATRSTSSTAPATAARLTIPSCTVRFRRSIRHSNRSEPVHAATSEGEEQCLRGAAQSMAGHGRGGSAGTGAARGVPGRIVCREPGRHANRVARARGDAARQDRSGDHHDPLRGRTVRLPGGRSSAAARERHHRRRRRRRAVRRTESMGLSSIPMATSPPCRIRRN